VISRARIGPAMQDAVDLGRVVHQPRHLGGDRREFLHRDLRQRHLEMPEERPRMLVQHRLRRRFGQAA
jgi:hypothetical protein